MKFRLYFVVSSFSVLATALCSQEPVEVEIANGKLIGEKRNNLYAFEGIPYVEAPIGDLRFEPPVPYTQEWTEPREAKTLGSHCLQWNHFKFDQEDKLEGNEDCLYLNVYTPTLEKKLPVIVYIHGGGFMFGSPEALDAGLFTARERVVVHFNYRLGPLGFLTTEDKVVPGNMGLKDQVEALKWVQKNIAAFGGDSDEVTLFGFSAGAASVHLHYLSPKSKDLFKRGISISGSALNAWAITEEGRQRALKLGVALGCSPKNVGNMIKCLKEKSADEIVRHVPDFHVWLYNPVTAFAPVVEPKGDDAFISEQPIEIIIDGRSQKLPWLASAAEDEGLYPASEYFRDEDHFRYLDENWNDLLPHILVYNETIPSHRLNEVSQKIRQHYIGDSKIDEKSFPKIVQIYSDRFFKYGLSQSVRLHSANAQAYFYHFRFKSQFGIDRIVCDRDLGVGHGEDVHLLFNKKHTRGDSKSFSVDEKRMIEVLLDLFSSFSKDGVPGTGEYNVPRYDFFQPEVLKHACIDGPDLIATALAEDFGQEYFWMSLEFEEN